MKTIGFNIRGLNYCLTCGYHRKSGEVITPIQEISNLACCGNCERNITEAFALDYPQNISLKIVADDYSLATGKLMGAVTFRQIFEQVGAHQFILAADYAIGGGYKATFVYDVVSNSWTLGAD